MDRPAPRKSLVILALLFLGWGWAELTLALPISVRLQAGLEDPAIARQVNELDWPALRRVYRALGLQPIWMSEQGPNESARALRRRIQYVIEDGLAPHDYHLQRIESLWGRRDSNARAWLELYLSDAFLRLGYELAVGYGHPRRVDVDWYLPPPKPPRMERLLIRIGRGQARITTTLERLIPRHAGYHALKAGLAHYRDMARLGPWPRIPRGPTLRVGDRNHRVALLRERLRREGYPVGEGPDSRLFDTDLEAAVREFQRRHGHTVDGLVGPRTRASLNVPLEERIRQIQRNMERWRWLPDQLGKRHILVNMAGYRLEYVEDGETRLTMRTVVGSRYRATPSFADRVRYLEINPEWKVPPRLARDRFLAKLRRDPTWLTRHHMKLYAGWYPDAMELDPRWVNWTAVDELDFPYKIIQSPGPHNALGRIKFMFPNRFRIYLHDTAQRELFDRPVRTFSGGCIRVERPIALASLLLGSDYPPEVVSELIQRGEPIRLDLPRPVPIYLLYWTAWAEGDGPLHFRRDIYGRDRLIAAPGERPVSPLLAEAP